MRSSALTSFAAVLALAQACTQCPHPGVFTGKLSLFTNPQSAYCGLSNTPANSIYASVPASFFDPPDESPCEGPINVTNPTTKKTIQAITVGKCTTCKGDNILLTTNGLAALAPDANPNHAPGTVSWTFD